MTVIMFVQQKLTPNASVDQNAQKVMMIMPLVFGFIMKEALREINAPHETTWEIAAAL
jgi:hypothetical protein